MKSRRDILSRSQSIKESLAILKNGTWLWKIRNKGSVRGIKYYSRKFELDVTGLRVKYTPNKGVPKNSCAFPSGDDQGVDLDDICEIRCGHGTDTFNLFGGANLVKVDEKEIDLRPHMCFSIIFKDGRAPLDLVAEDKEDRDHWVDALTHLVITIRSLGQQKEYELYLRKMFKKADKNNNGVLTFEECGSLIEQLNMKLDSDNLRKRFDSANFRKLESEEALDEKEFIQFYYSLLENEELKKIFEDYLTRSPSSGYKMTPKDLQNFLFTEQKFEATEDQCRKFIEAYEPSDDRSCLSVEGFTQFMMFSEWQSVLDEGQCSVVYQDMSHPLSHYWIASSHNTYLLANQVTGPSSVDAYIKALKEGCRCVELDCWDGEDGEPIIYHGWTLTSKISFREVIVDAIKPYAFKRSDYPLILSLENHCSIPQQDKMADILVEVLGSILYKELVDEGLGRMPSPEDLKRKVLVKAKKLPSDAQGDGDDEEGEDPDDERDEKRKALSKKISKKLSDLVNYVHAVHFPGFENEGKFYHMSSFGESKTFGLIDDPETAAAFVKYNTRQISRIYPAAKRQDSSNFKPLEPWNAGCQMVALNYQTNDKQTFRNKAKFIDNGGCGYILKPEFLRMPDPDYSPLSANRMVVKVGRTLKVKIVSGHHLPRPDGSLEGGVIDPYVKVKIKGHRDEKENKQKTKEVKNNGFNPVWNEEFVFVVKIPALAFLEMRVQDKSTSGSDKTIGAFTCPVNMLQEGYRRVPLKTYDGMDLSPACLLVNVLFIDDRNNGEIHH